MIHVLSARLSGTAGTGKRNRGKQKGEKQFVYTDLGLTPMFTNPVPLTKENE
jgi:hypothetical protein